MNSKKIYTVFIISCVQEMRSTLRKMLAPGQYGPVEFYIQDIGEVANAYEKIIEYKENPNVEPIDIIILDLDRSDGAGLKLLRSLKKDSEIFHIPVIAITGDFSLIGATNEWGASGFIPKPLSAKQLLRELTQVVNLLSNPQERILQTAEEALLLQDFSKALETVENLECQLETKKEQLNSKGLTIKGKALLGLNRHKEAQEILSEARNDAMALYLPALKAYIQTVELSGIKKEEELELLETLDRFNPQHTGRKIKLGEKLFAAGKKEEAVKHLREAQKLRPSNEQMEKIGQVLIENDQFDEFKKSRQNLPNILSFSQAEKIIRIAINFRLNGEYQKALECYNYVLRYYPHNARVLYSKGGIYILQKKFREACKYFQMALDAEPEFKKASEAIEKYCPDQKT